MSVSYGGSSITFEDGSIVSSGSAGFKNKIINGAMTIDQRNGGASVTTTTSGAYNLDRWNNNNNSGASRFTVQQISGDAPAEFAYYLGCTSSGAYSIASGDVLLIRQIIEGFNIIDLAWGTANAKTITLSFWVRSSLTGTFGGSIKNPNAAYSYPFTYTINQANTWEKETIIIPGPTASTWNTSNLGGVELNLSLGTGSEYAGAAGSWSANDYRSASGTTSVVATNGATWQLTGVQLEKGTTASSFEFRSIQKELMLCQRYLPAFIAQSGTVGPLPGSATALGTGSVLIFNHPVPARVPGTGVGVSAVTHFNFSNNDGNSPSTAVSFAAGSPDATQLSITVASSRGATTTPGWFYANNTAARLYITGCEL